VQACFVSSSPFQRGAPPRPPFSVSSACHSCPHDFPDDNFLDLAPRSESGLDEAFRRHGGALLSFLGRRAGYDAAPDLMQDVFARAAGSPQRHSLVNPGGFLRRIAQNLLKDRARRQRRENVLLLPLHEDHDPGCAPEQEHALEAADLLRLYEEAVAAMPVKTRRVFLMHRVDEMSYREIHERLGISIATVEYHMMRALARISVALDGR
jgi:RNA polymerase sigma-70 factor (ECF subfamily)